MLRKKIAHNTLIQIIGKIISTAIGIAAIALISRYLGPVYFGKFTIIFAFVQFSGIIFDLGLYLITLQDISEPRANVSNVLSQMMTLRFYLNIAYVGLTAVVAGLLPFEPMIQWGIIIMSFSNFFIYFTQILGTIYQKTLTTHFCALAETVGRSVLIISIVLCVYFNFSLLLLAGTVALASLANFLAIWWWARNKVKLKFFLEKDYITDVLRRTWPVAVSIIFSLIYFKADTLILSVFKSDYDVGIYGIPYRALETLMVVPLLFVGLMLPILNKAYAQKNIAKFKHYLQRSFDALSMMALPLIFISLVLAKPAVLLIAGDEFILSAPVFKILMLATGIIFLSSLFSHTIIALKKQKAMTRFYLITALIALLGYLILIPRYSYFGAAWMTVAAESLILIFTFYTVWQTTKFAPDLKIFGKTILASLLMTAAAYFLRNFNIFLSLSIAGLIYLGGLYVLKAVSPEMIKELVKFKGR